MVAVIDHGCLEHLDIPCALCPLEHQFFRGCQRFPLHSFFIAGSAFPGRAGGQQFLHGLSEELVSAVPGNFLGRLVHDEVFSLGVLEDDHIGDRLDQCAKPHVGNFKQLFHLFSI